MPEHQALTLPIDPSSGGSYSSPGYYILDQNGSPMDGPYGTPAIAMAHLKGRAGVGYLDNPLAGTSTNHFQKSFVQS